MDTVDARERVDRLIFAHSEMTRTSEEQDARYLRLGELFVLGSTQTELDKAADDITHYAPAAHADELRAFPLVALLGLRQCDCRCTHTDVDPTPYCSADPIREARAVHRWFHVPAERIESLVECDLDSFMGVLLDADSYVRHLRQKALDAFRIAAQSLHAGHHILAQTQRDLARNAYQRWRVSAINECTGLQRALAMRTCSCECPHRKPME